MEVLTVTFTVFQGCWIERHSFQGFPGCYDFPGFLRRMTGLGQCVGGTMFPSGQFDEEALFTEITSVIANMEIWVGYVNDLLSFYKGMFLKSPTCYRSMKPHLYREGP